MLDHHVYVLVRTDLSPTQVAVQAAHAAIEVARSLLPADFEHPHLVICAVSSETKLTNALEYIRSKGIVCKPFTEADRNDELTAFATEPLRGERRTLFRKFQLLRPSHLAEGGAA